MTTLEKIEKLTGLTFVNERSIDWRAVSEKPLTEEFIREFQDKVNWNFISTYQKLSEDFIREFQDKVNWKNISVYQKLSENFIRKFQDKVDWDKISRLQTLSEKFIRKFQYKVRWSGISKHQRLSEDFICEFQDKVFWSYISKYQRLSKDFISKFGDYLYKDLIIDNWIYKPIEEKKQTIIETGKYECHEDYFIAYKAIKDDRYSKFNFQYQYLPGQEYESWCDCSEDENSFGLSVGTMKFCENYADRDDIIVKVQIRYEDVGRVVYDGEKIRCFKFKILD